MQTENRNIFSERRVSLVDEQEFAQSCAQRQAGWHSIRTPSSTPSLSLDSRFILSNQKPEGHALHVSTLVSNALILLELQENYYMKIRYYLQSQEGSTVHKACFTRSILTASAEHLNLKNGHGEGHPVWGDPSGPLAVTRVLWGPSPSPPLPPPSFCPHRGSCQDGPSLMPSLGKDPAGTQHVRSVSCPALMVASLPGLAGLWVSGSCSLHDPAALPPSQHCSRGPASGPAREWAHGG